MGADGGHRSRALPVAPLIALAVLLAGCGGGNGPGGATGPGQARDRSSAPEPLIAAGDDLCLAAQVEQERIRRDAGGDQLTLDDRARLLVDLAPLRVRLAEDLAALQLPDSARVNGRELLRAARARGAASARAGRLWERGAPEELIAAAAAREHDERLRFVEAARAVGLRDCAERLSGPEQLEVERTLERALASRSARRRCREFGERYLEQEFGGGVDDCAASGAPPLNVEQVRIRELQGMDEAFAIARIETGGGEPNGRYRVRITHEDGAYRIDKLD